MKKITFLGLIIFSITVQAQNKVFSGISEYYDVNTSSWQNYSGANYEYDSNNNVISAIGLEWDLGIWKNYSKTNYTYNASNKATEEVYQEWNSTTNAFENVSKDSYTYTSGKPTEIVYYEWTNPNWVLKDKTVITYNSNNLPDGALSYIWNGIQWLNDTRYTTTYNSNNKLIEDIGEKWVSSNWVNDYKSIYTYDSNNKLVTSRFAIWDIFNTIWVEMDRIDYTIDANGNRITTTYSGSFDSKLEYSYDTSSLMTNFANPFKDKTGLDYFAEDFPHINKVLGYNEYRYDTQTSSFVINGRSTYNYANSITLGTQSVEVSNFAVTVFPNPAKDFLYIQNSTNSEIEKIIVSDISGRTVLQKDKIEASINVEKLAAGIYILQASSGNQKFQTKFIKE